MKLQKIKHLFEIQLMLSMYLIVDRFLIIMENCYKPCTKNQNINQTVVTY